MVNSKPWISPLAVLFWFFSFPLDTPLDGLQAPVDGAVAIVPQLDEVDAPYRNYALIQADAEGGRLFRAFLSKDERLFCQRMSGRTTWRRPESARLIASRAAMLPPQEPSRLKLPPPTPSQILLALAAPILHNNATDRL